MEAFQLIFAIHHIAIAIQLPRKLDSEKIKVAFDIVGISMYTFADYQLDNGEKLQRNYHGDREPKILTRVSVKHIC
jgi:hypothetical protein